MKNYYQVVAKITDKYSFGKKEKYSYTCVLADVYTSKTEAMSVFKKHAASYAWKTYPKFKFLGFQKIQLEK